MIDADKILQDFKTASAYWAPIHKEMEADFEFEAGKQWDDDDVATLEKAGVKALTINKIRPIIKLISGIERQSKSDFVGFPEGQEDGLIAEIVTSLLKNVSKQAEVERKLSQQFKRGVIGGMDFIEPYIDYTYDILNGELCLRNIDPMSFYPDPNAKEYDLYDAKYLIKYTPDLTIDDLLVLFPDKENEINKISDRKVNIDSLAQSFPTRYSRDYGSLKDAGEGLDDKKDGYDLVDYHYKAMVDRYYIIDPVLKTIQDIDDKKVAEAYASEHPDVKVIKKKVPSIRTAFMVGSTVIQDDVAWTYPNWKRYPIIPFWADWQSIPLKKRQLMVQGIVRQLKDLQNEYNKRRTQELRHLNSSVNSGIMYADDALSPQEEEKLKKFGSSPGVTIKYKAGTTGKPERISPQPLSQGHAQLATENAQDLKEASGVNPDLLANSDTSQSGRAILLKQKQGLVMIQEYLDNYSETKRILGRFLLSQLSEVYTVETATKVLGDDFLNKHDEFKKPVTNQMGQPQLNEQTGQLDLEVDQEAVAQIFNKVLNESSDLAKYDITIGEGVYSETVRMANYLTLVDMAGKGIPIPPDVLVGESMLSDTSKQKIIASIEQQQLMAKLAATKQPQEGAPDVGRQANTRNH